MIGIDVGGIAALGNSGSVISDCYNIGNLSISYSSASMNTYVGGVVAYNSSGKINNCYNAGQVTSAPSQVGYAGGIAAYNDFLCTISNCYNKGDVIATSSGDSFAGGITGENLANITNCYNIGNIKCNGKVGGINGCVYGSFTITNCYYLNNISNGSNTYNNNDTTTSLSSSQMMQQSSFSGFDFSNTWAIDNTLSYQYPTLIGIPDKEGVGIPENTTDFSGGNGTSGNPYKVSNIAQLDNVRKYMNADYILTTDITFTAADFAAGGDFYNGGKGWNPIGSGGTGSPNTFSGTFNGNGHTITGLAVKLTGTSTYDAGLFGYCSGKILNLGLINDSLSSDTYVGGIAGDNEGSIVNCFNAGKITGVNAGGIVGYNNGTISNCYNSGDINSTGSSGGIAGNNQSVISNCFNSGDVTSSANNAGGIVGNNYGPITYCYNSGNVAGTCIGGIIGYNNSGINCTASNCYYLNIISNGFGGGYGGDGHVTATALSSDEMMQQSSFSGFDFTNTWKIDTSAAYQFPTLIADAYIPHTEKPENTTDFAGGNGTVSNPYKISDKTQLNNARKYMQASFILTSDIAFTAADFAVGGAFYNNGAGWYPIGGADSDNFRGNFDGNGHIIAGLFCNANKDTTIQYAGLFGYSSGKISNVGLVNDSFTGKVDMGGIAGYNTGTITNCYNAGNISSSGGVGGIAGENEGTISKCYNSGNITGSNSVGGIAGHNLININNCYNTGVVSVHQADIAFAGGIAGQNSAQISNCYNTNDVSASVSKLAYVGGISGNNNKYDNVTITNCFNTGDITADSSTDSVYVGGIAGCNMQQSISSCYSTGNVSGSTASSSGFAYLGEINGLNDATISNCYYSNNTFNGVGSGSDTTTLLSQSLMVQQSSFAGFDFTNTWKIDSSATYKFPTLITVPYVAAAETPENTIEFAGGNGTPNNPFKVSKESQLNFIRNDLNACYILTSDIIFTPADFALGGAFYNSGDGWNPIGADNSNPFYGTFDGNGHTISGLTCDVSSSTSPYAGLFGYNCGSIVNVGLTNDSFTGISFLTYVGGIVGYNGENGFVNNCYNLGSINGTSAGGIAGYNCSSATISNCYNSGNVNAAVASNFNVSVIDVVGAGGIAGSNAGTIIKSCNTGNVTLNSLFMYAGGIAGDNSSGRINNCVNKGCVEVTITSSNNNFAGGIDGRNSEGVISNCFNTGSVISSSSSNSFLGSIVGYNDNTINNCYFLNNMSQGVGYGSGSTTALTSSQIALQSSFPGFDFTNTWSISQNGPYLKSFPTHTVTYNSEGGSSVNSQTVVYNNTAAKPTDPSRTGYTFAGWYTAASGGSAVNFRSQITADVTYYALWIVNSYTVIFNSNGGTSISNMSANYNTAVSAPTSPTRTGYTFNGWYTAATGGSKVTFPYTVIGNVTLYAQWTSNNPPASALKGDVTGDGKVDALDLLQLKKYLLGQVSLSDDSLKAADVNGDGKVDALDLLQLKKYLLGQVSL